MNKDDKEETRQMISDIIGKPLEDIIGRLNVMNANMVRIEGNTERTEKHAEKTNGRVNTLEKQMEQLKLDEIQHILKCPNNNRIQGLENNEVSRKAVAKFLIMASTLAGIIGGLVFAFLELILK